MRTRNDKLQELIAEQAAEWYVAHRDGGLSETQTRDFMRWLRASPAHVAEYLSMASMAQDIAAVAAQSDDSLGQLRADGRPESNVRNLVSAAVMQEESRRPDMAPHDGGKRRSLFSRWPSAMAAMLVMALAAAFWFQPWGGPQKFATRHGEQRTLQLPDNTVVRLNSDSAIVVSFNSARRDVEVLRGQVFFEIGEDPLRPFNVRADTYLIEDIGTAFDVYRKEAETTVTVVEGRVRVWEKESQVSAQADGVPSDAVLPEPLADLEAGAQVHITRTGQIQVQRPNVEVATAWVQEKIVFEADPIATVAAEFNRYNRQQIVIDDPRVGAIPISGVFRSYDVQSFAEFLNSLPGVRAEISEGRIVVTAAGAGAG